jgi:hypothetical protein
MAPLAVLVIDEIEDSEETVFFVNVTELGRGLLDACSLDILK